MKHQDYKGLAIALKEGANPNCRDEYDKNLSWMEILKYAFHFSSNKQAKGRPLLIVAVDMGFNDMAVTLIQHGANVNTLSTDGQNALMVLVNGFAYYTPEDQHLLRLLVSKGVDINKTFSNGMSILMRLSATSDTDDVKLLLNMGAQVDMQDHDGMTALMYAARVDETDNIRVLIAHGAKLDIKNRTGKTALGVAKQYVRYYSIKELSKAGATN